MSVHVCLHAVVTKWISLGLPVSDLLRANHTVFSEESGEIALSVLTHAQPINDRTDIKTTRAYWHMTKSRYEAFRDGETLPRVKKQRVVGMTLFFFLFDLHYWLWSDRCTTGDV